MLSHDPKPIVTKVPPRQLGQMAYNNKWKKKENTTKENKEKEWNIN